MPETVDLGLSLLGGGALGMVFFGGLWLTVQKGLGSGRPAVCFFMSFLLRTAVILAGLYIFSAGDRQRLLVCLLGCMAGRLFVTWLDRMEKPNSPARRAGHAA